MMIKKGAYEKHKEVIDFINSKEMIDDMLNYAFPKRDEDDNPLPLNWIGWESIYNTDLKSTKADIQKRFFEEFNKQSV